MNFKLFSWFPFKMNAPAISDTGRSSSYTTDILSTVRAFFDESRIRTIFDIGAHAGITAQQFHDTFPNATIYCFEPSPRTFKILSERFSANHRIKLFNAAVLDKPGTAEFYCNKESPTDSILQSSPEAHQWVDGKDGSSLACIDHIKVESIVLDAFCQQNGIDSIDFLKIDTQGADLLVLNGAKDLLRQKKIKIIQSELMFVPVYKNQPFFYHVCDFLGTFGYSLVNLSNVRFDEDDGCQIKWADGLFVYRGWNK